MYIYVFRFNMPNGQQLDIAAVGKTVEAAENRARLKTFTPESYNDRQLRSAELVSFQEHVTGVLPLY